MSEIGQVLRERYQLVAEIGRGGMSTVYLAKDLNLDSYWAVKKVKNDASVALASFKKEVELLASLNYPDIPRIVDRIEIADDYYVVMDFVDGSSLGKIVLTNGPLAEETVIEYGKMLCDVLSYLHTAKRHPIIYRDMKPENVMLTQAGRIKLIDFGIARECPPRSKQTDGVGTRGYAAPEQYKGASNLLDERTDIYALGATMYYLVTGITPGRPPGGVGSIRLINPALSEGLDYVILRCTQDDPELRYQNSEELKADLENIAHLTSAYRRKMKFRLSTFVASLFLSALFLFTGAVGYQRVMADHEDLYQKAFQAATVFDRNGEYTNAAEQYALAIEHKPEDYDTYMFLLRALLPQNEEQADVAATKTAIDEMRKKYIDNPISKMHNDPRLMYQVTRYCVQVDDPVYAAYAVDYINRIKESDLYLNGGLNAKDIDSYGIIASYMAEDVADRDFTAFNDALLALEESNEDNAKTADEQLENYYTIIKMYSTYPLNLENAYIKIYEIGIKAKEVVDSNLNADTMTFNSIVPLYELVAIENYNSAAALPDMYGKEEAYRKSIEWFGYLEDLNINLPVETALKKANAHKGIFDLYFTPGNMFSIEEETLATLDKAIEIYSQILEKEPETFSAQVYLTQALLGKEMVKEENERNFERAYASYLRAENIKDSTPNLSGVMLSQFGALKQQMINVGIEVGE